MSVTKSIEFYAGKKNVPAKSFWGTDIKTYQFTKDIAYTDISFSDMAQQLKEFMIQNDVKVGYCDISADFGGGYSLMKRYTFVNKEGHYITKKYSYSYWSEL